MVGSWLSAGSGGVKLRATIQTCLAGVVRTSTSLCGRGSVAVASSSLKAVTGKKRYGHGDPSRAAFVQSRSLWVWGLRGGRSQCPKLLPLRVGARSCHDVQLQPVPVSVGWLCTE